MKHDAFRQHQQPHKEDENTIFPTHAAMTVPVEIRSTPEYGPNQYGLFAKTPIAPQTPIWKWTHRVQSIHKDDLKTYIATAFPKAPHLIPNFLRRGFVLPPPNDDHWHSNPTDVGSLMNHSSTPNCGPPVGTLRRIEAGEELTMDYGGNGNPQWYIDICHEYGILTGVEIARRQESLGKDLKPAVLERL